MIKKIMMVLALITLVFSASFADVYIKDLDGTNVEVVFTFKDDAATEMAVIGDFCGWVEPGIPMAKNADGKWEVAVKSTVDGVLKYKFWYKGTYIYDFKSPDKIDDGFGGNNGLIEVSKVLAKQKAAELAASGDAAGAAALMAQAGGGDSGLKFLTLSMLGFQTKFDTVDTKKKNAAGVEYTKDDKGLDSAGINLKSYWKMTGNAVPNMPVFFEIAVAEQEGFNNLYQEGAWKKTRDEAGKVTGAKKDADSLPWKNGLTNFLVDTIFDPVYFLDGQSAGATALGHFKAGFETDWFTYTTGYKYAKLPPHSNVNWTTVTDNWDAGYNSTGGYSYFATGNAVTEWFNDLLGAKIKAAVAPNKSADRAGNQYGMYAWTSAEFAGQYIDFQYNGAYGKTFDTIFGHIYEADFILGYQGKFGPVTAKANGLINMYGDGDLKVVDNEVYKTKYIPSSSDVGAVDPSAPFVDNIAANINLSYSDDYVDVTAGWRARGNQANMMYVKQADGSTPISDQLGGKNTMKAWLDFNYKLAYGNVGINPYMQTTFVDKDTSTKEVVEIGAKLFGGYDFDVVKFDAYVNGTFKTEQPEDTKPFSIGDIGLKVSTPLVLNGLALVLGYDPADADADFITGIFELGLPAGINAQAGMGYRVAKAESVVYEGKELGFFVGANMKLNIPQKPILYTQFVWGMDPYKGFGDGQDNINYDGYTLGDGAADYANAGAFRVALRWDI